MKSRLQQYAQHSVSRCTEYASLRLNQTHNTFESDGQPSVPPPANIRLWVSVIPYCMHV